MEIHVCCLLFWIISGIFKLTISSSLQVRELDGPERAHRRPEAQHGVRVQRQGAQGAPQVRVVAQRLQQDVRSGAGHRAARPHPRRRGGQAALGQPQLAAAAAAQRTGHR